MFDPGLFQHFHEFLLKRLLAMMSASGTPSGCIVSVGSLAGGVAGALPPASSLQASGLLWSFYILGACDTLALQPKAATARIVVQASSLQLQASGLLSKVTPLVRLSLSLLQYSAKHGFPPEPLPV
jgi:hypothetical protein